MEKSALIDNCVNYNWNFLNYPIHTVSAKPEQTSKECAILLIHGFGASTDHWRFNMVEWLKAVYNSCLIIM